ncbi:GNAT family N-acetyltransferase [uncultured Enterococcus sp.]|uniref:GNAT family N-acetyltransferase n=1 Tax=uncultured Enterococcus sp. TaxID=167972 RepID=UPI002AA8720D|nr:GNAT family N-acetyltransferase [uncultured Enterococcus sp.]
MATRSKIKLVPARLEDRKKVYDWCFQSETTKSHSGPPHFSEKSIASYEEFCTQYYEEYYFTGSNPEKGRGYLIVVEHVSVGFVSYSAFHLKPSHAEFDIWMNSEANCGKGFGTEALVLLSEFLEKEMNVTTFIIAPSVQNKRAVRSYEKAGFQLSNRRMKDFLKDEYISIYGEGDYGVEETALMLKCIN